MKQLLKRILFRAGYSLHRLPPGIVTGVELSRDLRLVLGHRDRAVAIDVGANVGDTVTLIRDAMPGCTVHAFEPNPATFATLQQRHGQTPGIVLNNSGVGSTEDTLKLNAVANHALNSFLPLTPDGRRRLDVSGSTRVVEVPVVRLDTYATNHDVENIDLLKIDTQGFEMHVLQGAVGLFDARRVACVLIELNFVDLYAGQAKPVEIISFLQERGFHLVDLYEKCRHNPVLAWCTALFVQRNATH